MASYEQLNGRAFALPVIGFLALTSPILMLFNIPDEILGVPILYFYAFAIWLVLIIAIYLLSQQLAQSDPPHDMMPDKMGDTNGEYDESSLKKDAATRLQGNSPNMKQDKG